MSRFAQCLWVSLLFERLGHDEDGHVGEGLLVSEAFSFVPDPKIPEHKNSGQQSLKQRLGWPGGPWGFGGGACPNLIEEILLRRGVGHACLGGGAASERQAFRGLVCGQLLYHKSSPLQGNDR